MLSSLWHQVSLINPIAIQQNSEELSFDTDVKTLVIFLNWDNLQTCWPHIFFLKECYIEITFACLKSILLYMTNTQDNMRLIKGDKVRKQQTNKTNNAILTNISFWMSTEDPIPQSPLHWHNQYIHLFNLLEPVHRITIYQSGISDLCFIRMGS